MLMIPSFRESREEKTDGVTNWKEYLAESGKRFLERFNEGGEARQGVSLGDFELIRTVGTGWYGRVILARSRSDRTYHALKVFTKESIVRLDQVHHVFSERKIFRACDFPFITKLEYYFTDNSNIYFVMPFIVGGELFGLLKKLGRLGETSARFYSAQIILVLEYLHNVGVVYRDIKPENILLDKDGYVKVTDFGFAKMVGEGRTYTMCGTPEYFAPEMISSVGYGCSVDWWSLGVLIYEMCCGHTPFSRPNRSSREKSIFKDILSGMFAVPHEFSDDLKEVIYSLLQVEIWKRLGGQKLRQLSWYRPVNWLAILNRRTQAPYVPSHASDHDPNNYDLYEETPLVTSLHDDYAQIFQGF